MFRRFMGQAVREDRRTLFQGLMVTVDKVWVGVLTGKCLPSGSCFLACWGLAEMFPSVLSSSVFLLCPNEGALTDLSSAMSVSMGVSFLQLVLGKGECVQTKFSRGIWGPCRHAQGP